MRFYALVGITYWLFSSYRNFAWAWLVIEAVALIQIFTILRGNLQPHWALQMVFQPHHLHWFTLGICAFYHWKRRVSLPVILMAALAIAGLVIEAAYIASASEDHAMLNQMILFSAVALTFIAALKMTRFKPLLEHRWAIMLGLASYPLYMFHERVGVIAMNILSDLHVPVPLIPVIVMAGIIGTAIAIHRLIENPSKSVMLAYGMPLARQLQSLIPALRFRRREREQLRRS